MPITNTAARYSQALSVIDKELSLQPNKSESLLNKGWLSIQLGRFEDAIAPLNRVIALETSNEEMTQRARFNRGIAFLQLGRLTEAQNDYVELQKAYTNSFPVFYGLGEIAYRKKDTNAAIHFYESYLRAMSNAPASAEVSLVKSRLQELKAGSR